MNLRFYPRYDVFLTRGEALRQLVSLSWRPHFYVPIQRIRPVHLSEPLRTELTPLSGGILSASVSAYRSQLLSTLLRGSSFRVLNRDIAFTLAAEPGTTSFGVAYCSKGGESVTNISNNRVDITNGADETE